MLDRFRLPTKIELAQLQSRAFYFDHRSLPGRTANDHLLDVSESGPTTRTYVANTRGKCIE